MWWAHAALACGDTVRAREWADRAAASGSGMFLCLTFAVNARVHLAEDNNERGAADAYDGLAIGASMKANLAAPDFLQCLAELAVRGGNSQQAVRLLAAASTMRYRLELARFKVYDEHHDAMIESLRNIMGHSDFDDAWAVAVSASGRPPAGLRSLLPNSTWCAWSLRAYPTRTSPPGCSSHRAPCSRICATSTTSLA